MKDHEHHLNISGNEIPTALPLTAEEETYLRDRGLFEADAGGPEPADEPAVVPLTRRWPDLEEGPWLITVDYARVGGRVDAVAFSISSIGRSRRLTAEDLRKVPFGEIRREQRARLAGVMPEVRMSQATRQRLAGLADGLRQEPPRSRRKSDEFFAEVAAVYRAAMEAGDAPTAAVQVHFHVSYPTAGRWVSRCRKMGLLGPTRPGVAGEFPEDEDHASAGGS